MRFFAMGRPMMPSPMNPMVCAMAPPTEDGYAGENPREHWTLSRAPQRSNTRRAKGSRWIAPDTFHPRLENPDRRQLRRRARERVRRQDEQIRALTGFETPGDRVDARGARSAERVGLECFRDGHRLVGRRDVAIAARARDRGRDTQERRVRAAGEVRRERLLHAGARRAGERALDDGRIEWRRVRRPAPVPQEGWLDDDPDAERRDARDELGGEEDRVVDSHTVTPIGTHAHRVLDGADRRLDAEVADRVAHDGAAGPPRREQPGRQLLTRVEKEAARARRPPASHAPGATI